MAKDDIPTNSSVKGQDINGKPINAFGVDFSHDKFKGRRSISRTAVKSLKINRISSTLGSRMLVKRGGVNFHPLKNVYRSKADNFFEWRQKQKEAAAKEIETGSPNGTDSPTKSKRAKVLERLKSFANTAKGPAIVAGTVCAVKSFSDGIDAQNLENQQQLMRIGMRAITIPSQMQSNQDYNMDILHVYSEAFFDEETGTSWVEDPGIQQELGLEPTGRDYAKDVKPGKEKPAIFRYADQIPDPLGVCGFIEAAGNAPGVKQLGEASTAILAGLGLDVDKFYADAQQYFTSGAVDALAEGAKAGGQENIGARLAANDNFITNAARELTPEEASEAKKFVAEELKTEFASASIFERYFDIFNSQSVVAQVFLQAPKTGKDFIATISRLPQVIGSMFANAFTSSSVSAAATYDYGFPLYGFSVGEQENLDFEDPFANAAYIESGNRLQTMNADYGKKCFGLTISATGDLEYGQAPDFTKIPDECKDPTNSDLLKYRFYITDMVTGHTLACYEGDESSCRQIGFGATINTSGGTTAPAGGKIEGNPYTDSSGVACAPGTTETRKDEGWVDGASFPITLCELPNLPSSWPADNGFAHVNSRVSGAWFTLVKDAAADGVTFSVTSSYRTMAEQQEIWNRNPDPSAVARPGYSSHQAGVALDFANINAYTGKQDCAGGRATEAGNQYWDWLYDNAERYGFKQYSAEGWHWDALPMSNRCGSS